MIDINAIIERWTVWQTAFMVLVLLLVVQRLLELRHSKRNEAKMIAKGGREHAPGHFTFMKITHTLWFFAMVIEAALRPDGFHVGLAVGGFVALLVGQALRYAAITTLGERWSVTIMTVPGEHSVNGGIYKYIRHPNYLGVIIELAAVPLIHGAYITAVVFTVLNAIVLYIRIRAEEQALREVNEYDSDFAERPRFIPGA